jgi:hypothetical protein
MTMTHSDTLEDAGDTLFSDPESVMKAWFKYNSQDFIQLIVHEIRKEISVIETYTKVLLDDHDIASELIKSNLGAKTTEESGAAIMTSLVRLRQIMMIAKKYSLTQQSTDNKPEV